MSIDLLGPGNADNAVTARPGRTITRGLTDTWHKDCSSADANDGTAITADYLNDLLAQVRTALRSSGITLDAADDMLWRAMQSVGIRYAVDTGAANSLVCDFAPDVAALTDGLMLLVKVGHDNTGAVTLAADAQVAKHVVWPDGTELSGGMIKTGMLILVGYVGGVFQILSRTQPPSATGSTFKVGQIVMWPLDTPASGTLICDGSAVDRTTYASLYAVVGNSYGAGNGTTTFNLPDYRGMFMRGWANGSTNDPDRAARTNRGDGTTGDHVGTRQDEQYKTHAHPLTSGTAGGGATLDFTNVRGEGAPQGVDVGGGPLGTVTGLVGQAAGVEGMGPLGTAGSIDLLAKITNVDLQGNTGSSGGNETRPKNVAINFCIAY